MLGPEICEHVKILITNGATGPKIRQVTLDAPQYRPGCPQLVEREDLAGAVQAAVELAQPGDVVILSPASAAFDQFKNFMVRGAAFKEMIAAL